MEIDAKLLKKLEELKKQLEGISGQKIDASPEQLIPLFFRVSLLSSEDGVIMSRSIILMLTSKRFAGSALACEQVLPGRMMSVVRQPAPMGRRFSYLAISFAAPSILSRSR